MLFFLVFFFFFFIIFCVYVYYNLATINTYVVCICTPTVFDYSWCVYKLIFALLHFILTISLIWYLWYHQYMLKCMEWIPLNGKLHLFCEGYEQNFNFLFSCCYYYYSEFFIFLNINIIYFSIYRILFILFTCIYLKVAVFVLFFDSFVLWNKHSFILII